MKFIIAIVIVIILGSGLWYGYGRWRRGQILDSGRVVLLVDKKQGVYTYSDLLPRDEITSGFSIVGFADELFLQEVAVAIEGLRLVVGVPVTPGDPRIIATTTASAPIAEGTQLLAWNKATAALTAEQQSLCAKIESGASQQYCLARHLVYQAIKAGAGAESCEPFFVDYQKVECLADIQAQDKDRVADTNQNGLIDLFEAQAQAPEERVNTLNLPEISY